MNANWKGGGSHEWLTDFGGLVPDSARTVLRKTV